MLFIYLTALIFFFLFLITIVVSWEPREWRRLFQDLFQSRRQRSVNVNKAIDERIRKFGPLVACGFLAIAVVFFFFGSLLIQPQEAETPQDDPDSLRQRELELMEKNQERGRS